MPLDLLMIALALMMGLSLSWAALVRPGQQRPAGVLLLIAWWRPE